MNYSNDNPGITEYQLNEFQNLINILFQCCQDRFRFQSTKFKIPDAELRCLMLFADEKYLTPTHIAAKMNVGKSRMTKIIKGMTDKRLIKKTKDPEDSRVSLINLTSEGKNKLSEIKQFQQELHQVVLSQVDAEQRKKLLAALDVLKGCMETGKEFMAELK